MIRRALSSAMVTLVLLGALAGTALGHASMTGGTPAADATLTTPPSEVRLRFSERIEVAFSHVKVYRLDVAEEEQVPAAASDLVRAVLERRDDTDEAGRVDTGVLEPARGGSEIVIQLEESLAPGRYVVMWKVLSVDSHTTEGHYVFTYKPIES